MDYTAHEPHSLGATPRPCSTPHSAPVGWLRSEPAPEPPEAAADEPVLSSEDLDDLAAILRSDPDTLADLVSRIGPEQERKDGWSPFSRRLFLQVLADTGRVSTASEYTGLTRQSAYALRARDPVFAAGWDAACELARAPLADALYEKALDGVTDTITKDGAVVATRHRFDSRLSMAVLNRLDKRCDRAEERGSKHLALVARWDEWLSLVGKGADAEAAVLLEPVQQCQTCKLPESENPTVTLKEEEEEEGVDLSDRCWSEEEMGDKVWYTDFPPPPGFTGYEKGDWRDLGYRRECTPEEVEILEADAPAAIAAERAEDDALRDAWVELLRSGLEEQDPPPASPFQEGEDKAIALKALERRP